MPKELSTIYTGHLSIEELNSISHATLDDARPVLAEVGPVAAVAFATLETNNIAMGTRMLKPKKSDLTPAIAVAAKNRKTRWSEITRTTTTALKGSNAEKKESARLLKHFLEPCWNINTKPVNIQTTLYIELFKRCKTNPEMMEHATTVGVVNLLADLEPVNLNYQTLTRTRASLEATGGPSASILKNTVVENYNSFCIAIEQAVNHTPSEALTRLFEEIDGLRKEYAHFAINNDTPGDDETNPEPEE
jgi:hypothetical protein